MSPRAEDIKKLIFTHNRRLQKLKERQALEGISADPKIALEIEDIEAELEELQDELVQFKAASLEVVSPTTDGTPIKSSAEASYHTPMIDPRQYISETLYSTLLPVEEMPRYIYGTPCSYNDSQEKEATKHLIYPKDDQMLPFIIRGGMLFCFQNLRYKGGPFRNLVVDFQEVERYEARKWWDDPDKMNWFLSLLNRSLNKLTGRKGLQLDRKHKRYYFTPMEVGQPFSVSYRPLNKAIATRQVVWQPTTRKTGLSKNFWYHLAVSLRFHPVSSRHWSLSIRPELHVTKDGAIPFDSKKVGSKVTRKKARRFNYDLLGDLQFWRDFLSDSKPRVIFPFGREQRIVVLTSMMETAIKWPGIPEEYAKPFKNVEYEEDLFSWAEYANPMYDEDDDELADEDDYDEDHYDEYDDEE